MKKKIFCFVILIGAMGCSSILTKDKSEQVLPLVKNNPPPSVSNKNDESTLAEKNAEKYVEYYDACIDSEPSSCGRLIELCTADPSKCSYISDALVYRKKYEMAFYVLKAGCDQKDHRSCELYPIANKSIKAYRAEVKKKEIEKVKLDAMEKRNQKEFNNKWQRMLKAKYTILNSDSDYSDAVADGGLKAGSISFATCSCGLPSIPIENSEALLECYTNYGNHKIFVAGSQSNRRQLSLLGNPNIEHKVLFIYGNVIDLMKTTSSGTYGSRNLEALTPIIHTTDVLSVGNSYCK